MCWRCKEYQQDEDMTSVESIDGYTKQRGGLGAWVKSINNPPHQNDWKFEHWFTFIVLVVTCTILGILYMYDAYKNTDKGD